MSAAGPPQGAQPPRGTRREATLGGEQTRPPASLARRLACLGYDALLFSALAVVVGFLTLPLARGTGPAVAPHVPDLLGRSASFVLLFAAGALYFGWSWSGGRRTLAMKTWKIALERRDGRRVDGPTALLRYVAAWIGPALALAAYVALRPFDLGAHAAALLALNFAWAVVDPERQFLQDRIAGTRLVLA
jgi:uncharacterized RDD family membrane protein YckC